MARFNAINLAGLPPPPVVEVIDYEDILAALVADFVTRFSDYDVGALESDPVKKVLEVAAYREIVLRQRVNDAARAVMVASAGSGDLEHLGALFGVERMVVPGDPDADPPVPDEIEDLERYRERIQLSLEAYSTAGPYGAYAFYALSASLDVRDAGVYGPESELVDPGHVAVYVLSRLGDGTPAPSLLAAVTAALSPSDRRPLTDYVHVLAPTIVPFAATVVIEVPHGPDPAIVQAAALAKVTAYIDSRRRVGAKVSRDGIAGAAFVPGVEDVTVTSPVADVVPALDEAAHCTAVTVTVEVV